MNVIDTRGWQEVTRTYAPLADVRVQESGSPDGLYTIQGHAAVFNLLSLDLGGFQEKIDPGAFSNCLSRDPDVLGVWDHDTRYILARTRNKTMTLVEDETGLACWMRVAPTSYAEDLRILLDRKDIDQASFMFTIQQERWEWAGGDDDPIIATIEEVGMLYDTTVTGRGAYPQTDMSATEGRGARLSNALQEGRVPGLTLDDARERGLVTKNPDTAPAGPEAVTDSPPGGTEVTTNHRAQFERAKLRDAGGSPPQ